MKTYLVTLTDEQSALLEARVAKVNAIVFRVTGEINPLSAELMLAVKAMSALSDEGWPHQTTAEAIHDAAELAGA